MHVEGSGRGVFKRQRLIRKQMLNKVVNKLDNIRKKTSSSLLYFHQM